MDIESLQVLQTVERNAFYMCSGEELSALTNFSKDVISRIKNASDSPFFLGKARPEWIRDWMREHPEFQLSKASMENTEQTPAGQRSQQSNVNRNGKNSEGKKRRGQKI